VKPGTTYGGEQNRGCAEVGQRAAQDPSSVSDVRPACRKNRILTGATLISEDRGRWSRQRQPGRLGRWSDHDQPRTAHDHRRQAE